LHDFYMLILSRLKKARFRLLAHNVSVTLLNTYFFHAGKVHPIAKCSVEDIKFELH